MTTLDELLATIAEDAGTAARPATSPPPIPARVGEVDLDDGPVLTTDRLWPSAVPRPKRKGPPPPPPGRRARGTAPLGEPVNSGLIDVRAMQAAYQAEKPAPLAEVEAPTLALAEGTSPLPIIDLEPEVAEERRRGPSVELVRRVAIGAAVAAALAGAVAFGSTLLDRGERAARPAAQPPVASEMVAASEPAAKPAVVPHAVPEPAVAPEVAEPAVAEPAVATDVAAEPAPSADAPLEVHVIRLPTEVTEIDQAAADQAPKTRQPARVRKPASSTVVSGHLQSRPSNSEIASAVVAAHDQLTICGDLYAVSGPVPVKLRVAPSGAIASVAVNQGSTSFRSCVARALRSQRLPASQVGTTASFPVLIR